MNKLNGWQRIWVVIAIMWAVPVLIGAILSAPETPHSLRKQQESLMFTDETQKVHVDMDKLKKGDAVYVSDPSRWEKLFPRMKSYPRDLAVHVVVSSAVWASPLLAIYLLGIGIAWIRGGFSTKS
jgi:hypothetical protein